MELFLRVVFSLGLVLGLMWFLARTASRRMGGSNPSLVRMVGRQSLGRNASVAVLALGERLLVVGVTESGVRLLTEMEADEVELPETVTAPAVTSQGAAPAALPGSLSKVVPQGSVLSAQTWRQAWQAATTRGATDS